MSVRSIVYAKDLKLGDILDKTLSHGVMSVKQVTHIKNPATGENEVKIRGPLNIIDKFHENERVAVFRS